VIGFWLMHLLARRDLVAPMIGELLGSDRPVGQRIDEPRSKRKAAPEDGFS